MTFEERYEKVNSLLPEKGHFIDGMPITMEVLAEKSNIALRFVRQIVDQMLTKGRVKFDRPNVKEDKKDEAMLRVIQPQPEKKQRNISDYYRNR